MDKDCIIIFLILILIIALLNRRNDNKYTKDFQKYYKGFKKNIEKKINRESFYNLIPNNRYQASEEYSINNINTSDQEIYSENNMVRNIPYKVGAISYSGDNKMYVNSINGIQIGDKIRINPKGDNYEKKTVTGIGNNVLGLDSELEKEHVPNEPILNISNNDLNYGKVKEEDIKISRYAYINNQGKINYTPAEETWNVSQENNIYPSEEINGIEKENLYFI